MKYTSHNLLCFIIFSLLFAATVPAVAYNGWKMDSEEEAAYQRTALKGKSPVELARLLAHPNGHAASYAIEELATRGPETMPLLDKLIEDEHPMVRSRALSARIQQTMATMGVEGEAEDTPEMRRLISQMVPLVDDPALGMIVASFLERVKIDNEDTRDIAIKLSQSSEVDTRRRALKIALFIDDSDTRVKIGMYSSLGPKNIPRAWGHAHQLIHRYKDEPISDQAIPAIVAFFKNRANTEPVRGMFSDTPQVLAIEILKAKWSAEIQQQPDVVEALCRTYVRCPMPLTDESGWGTLRITASELVTKLDTESVPMIRAAIELEKKWLAETPPLELASLFGGGAEPNKRFQQNIDYLTYVADTLEAGNPITREPANLPKPPEKQYQDRVPGINDFDLDSILD